MFVFQVARRRFMYVCLCFRLLEEGFTDEAEQEKHRVEQVNIYMYLYSVHIHVCEPYTISSNVLHIMQ